MWPMDIQSMDCGYAGQKRLHKKNPYVIFQFQETNFRIFFYEIFNSKWKWLTRNPLENAEIYQYIKWNKRNQLYKNINENSLKIVQYILGFHLKKQHCRMFFILLFIYLFLMYFFGITERYKNGRSMINIIRNSLKFSYFWYTNLVKHTQRHQILKH